MKQWMRWGDLVIIGLVLLLAGGLFLGMFHAGTSENLCAEIWVDGVLRQSVPLAEGRTQTIALEEGNTVEIDGLRVSIAKATCKDQVCVRTGTLTRTGQSAVCLPHRVVVKLIAADNENDVDAVTA